MLTKQEEIELIRLLELEDKDQEQKRIKTDAEYFIENYVHIEDRDSEELAVLFHLWEGQKIALKDFISERLNIVLKARQLGLTWLALSYAVWCILFCTGFLVVALSKTEDDAKELIRRVVFILRHLPEWLALEDIKDNQGKNTMCRWTSTTMSVTILHSEQSVFNSFPAGPNSGRSFTANLVILDEWAFQQWAREIWAAAYPTINRPTGGKVIGLSTAKRMTLFEEIWRKAKAKVNTFNTIFLSWRTDPRRTEEWYEQTKRDLPLSYKAEYPNTPEEAFEAAEGVAFSEFSYDIHIVKPFTIPEHWSKWRSVDNGYTDSFAWYWFAVDEDGIVYIYREYTREPKDEKIHYSDQAKKVVQLTGIESIGYTIAGHDAWSKHPLTINAFTPQGKSIIDYYGDGGINDCVKCETDRKLRAATWHEYLKPYYDEVKKKWTAKVQIFDTCTKIIETLPQLVNDEKDVEKVMECTIDHWYDGCLTADTIINTPNGDYPIKQLVGKNGKVYCFDVVNEVYTISDFYAVRMTKEKAKVYEIETEDGRIIKATDNHPILTKKGWKEVKDLELSDEIVDIIDHI
jgi:hypothetical protein